jgi:N-acetylmuramoyl-L-alanine amidase
MRAGSRAPHGSSLFAFLVAMVVLAVVPGMGGPSSLAQPGGGDPDSYEMANCQVDFADDRSDQSIQLKRLAPPSEEWFLAGSDLADLLRVGRYWRSDVRKLVLRVDDRRITFTAGARAVVAGDDAILLRQPVALHQSEPWIPMEFLVTVLPQMTGRAVGFDPERVLLRVGTRSFNIDQVRVESGDAVTEVRIRMRESLAFRVDDRRSRQLLVKIYGGEIDPGAIRLGSAQGLVESIRSRQESGHALVQVELSELASRYQSLTEQDGRTILLRIEQAPVTLIPDPVPRGPHLVQTLPPEARGRRVSVRRVVIDPGHGGADLGAEGPNGELEKDITLAVARELKRALERRGDLEAVLTRESDENIGLVQRTEFANREGGDLFLSIHCNAWYDRGASGVETYFLAPAKSEWDATVARKENSAVGAAEDLDFILWDLVQNLYIQESATLAEAVQTRLSDSLGLPNRGVKQAGFRVLVGAFMPAILVEVGFLTNAEEAKRLGSASHQRRIAEALAEAVVDFRARMDAIREDSR